MRKVRFMSPVGSPPDRATYKIWPGFWFDYTGYGEGTHPDYTLGYHTGADLNLNVPYWNADKGMPFYSVWKGTVIFRQLGPGTWGQLVVVKLDPIDGKTYYLRFAHGTNIQVHEGQQVDEYTVLGYISNAEGAFGDHMHVDLITGDLFQWWHWPGWNLMWFNGPNAVYANITEWLRQEHFVEGEDGMPDLMIVTATDGVVLINDLPTVYVKGTEVIAGVQEVIGNTVYRQLLDTNNNEVGWVVESDPRGTYLTPKPPPAEIFEGYGNVIGGVNIRALPTTASEVLGEVDFNALVRYTKTGITANGYVWAKLVDQPGYVAEKLLRPKL